MENQNPLQIHLIPLSERELRHLIRAIRLSLKNIPMAEAGEMAAFADRLESDLLIVQQKKKELEKNFQAHVEKIRKAHFN